MLGRRQVQHTQAVKWSAASHSWVFSQPTPLCWLEQAHNFPHSFHRAERKRLFTLLREFVHFNSSWWESRFRVCTKWLRIAFSLPRTFSARREREESFLLLLSDSVASCNDRENAAARPNDIHISVPRRHYRVMSWALGACSRVFRQKKTFGFVTKVQK